jgi:hypothetical protein
MQATVEFFMQQFVEFRQHALSVHHRIMQRHPLAGMLIATITTILLIGLSEAASANARIAAPTSPQTAVAPMPPVDSAQLAAAPYNATSSASAGQCAACSPAVAARQWLISTRHLSGDARCINLTSPNFRLAQIDPWGRCQNDSMQSFLSQLVPGRPLVIHVHGNRMTEREALDRGRFIHHQLSAHLGGQSADFAIYSWPSERAGILAIDGRAKAVRTEAEGLYLAWLLRELVIRDIPVTIVGYSFGGRITTGGLHALAGGAIAGRTLPGSSIRGANIGLGLVAPAVGENALGRGGYHGLASQNIRQMALFYNTRDAILRRFPVIDIVRGGRALGYTGPQRLAAGYGGAPVPTLSRDCARYLGIRHSEVEYYTQGCRAGSAIAGLVRSGVYQ